MKEVYAKVLGEYTSSGNPNIADYAKRLEDIIKIPEWKNTYKNIIYILIFYCTTFFIIIDITFFCFFIF